MLLFIALITCTAQSPPKTIGLSSARSLQLIIFQEIQHNRKILRL